MTKKIALYDDEGVGEFSLFSTLRYFECCTLILLSADNIQNGALHNGIDLFVMPGGADRSYHKKLKGTGNAAIKNYLEKGGTYLGICAGAYYGCANIEFQKGQLHEICEARDLKIFDGIAIGCLPSLSQTPYNEKINSAAITSISIGNANYNTLYWGGCYFSGNLSSHELIGCYSELENKPAIISTNFKEGRAILSGVHFEVDSNSLQNFDFENKKEKQIAQQLARALGNSNNTLNLFMKEYLDV